MLSDALKSESVFGAWKKADKTKDKHKPEQKQSTDQVPLLRFMLKDQGGFPWVHTGATNSRNSPLLLHRPVRGAICTVSIQLLLS